MIFSVSSVCLAYLLGIACSVLYIRKLCLVGAGFFWMMWSINLSFALLSLISTTGNLQLLSFLCVVVSTLGLSITIFKRKVIREKPNSLELTSMVLIIVLSAVGLAYTSGLEFSGWEFIRETLRLLVGGTVLGGITSAMLLGHWYLVQPGLTRKPISKMCLMSIVAVAINILLWLVPPSMISVITGEVSDSWGGNLGYMWIGSAVTTLGLLIFAYKALQEKSYSAVMATTGLLYLAILVANGTELIPRAIFA